MSSAVLERPTLVLNRHWAPIDIATGARSLTMLWNESALVVDPDDFRLYSRHDWAQLAPKEGGPVLLAVTFATSSNATIRRADTAAGNRGAPS